MVDPKGSKAAATPVNEYETYVPKYSKSYWGYGPFLDRLGFKPKVNKVSRNVRDLFEKDLKAYVCVPLTKHLRREDNPTVFSALVLGFLKRYGTKYWGDKDRDHLLEPNPAKGFLCPRDYERSNSYFLETVEALFNRRAVMFRYRDTDMAKRGKPSKILGLDFAALKPEDLESLVGGNDLEDCITLIAGLKRQAPDSPGSSDDEAGTNDGYGPETRSKRRRLTTTTVDTVEKTPTKSATKRRTRGDDSLPSSAGPSTTEKAEPTKVPQAITNGSGIDQHHGVNGEELENLSLRQLQRLVYHSATPSTFKTLVKPDPVTSETALTRRPRGKAAASPPVKATPSTTPAGPAPQVVDIGSKVMLRVNVTTQQHMAPVNVKLSKYTGRQGLFEFLGHECILDTKSLKKIIAASVTCLWDNDTLRIRKSQIEADWEVFCEKLQRTFLEDFEIAEKGCKVDVLLHLAE